ncbi:alpha/beta hydrolase [Actinokineospora auranticolor]|uniref:Alpha/beta hydrolase family protein n=1 Tax=Actinokineospora auranticolor TaxID=155976 RepID=A0A2S6GDE5_9PSEU|nr:alpha/beta hydrolase [Actinokineospora auranticolor]PPK63229.1 alpha/beta hydrolase family protein [Actinokineospora auranticolor]
MRRIIRAVGGVAATVAVVLGVVPSAAAHQGPRLAWSPCVEDVTAECATLSLPVDWAKPRGARFDLAVARRTATDPRKRTGVLLINPGGPGGSGVDFALEANTFFSPRVLERFDVIGFDPRGVKRSAPVECSVDVLARQPSLYPANQTEFAALGAYNRELAADCRRQTGPIYDHVDSLSVVRDMDALRVALGERKINYYGLSYGTLIGAQYAEEFGGNIRAMVMDSVIDHSNGVRKFTEVSSATTEDSFAEFVEWCDRTTSCALHGRDVPKAWDDLLARADRGEVVDPADPTRAVDSTEIIYTAFDLFYLPAWDWLATSIRDWEAAAPTTRAAAPGVRTGTETAQAPFAAVFCQDWDFRVRDHREFAALVDRANRLAPHMRGSILAHIATTGCVGLPDKVNNPQHRLDVTDAPDLLMINAKHDPSTGHEWATNVHRQIRDTATLVTYEGWGHLAYNRTQCTRDVVDNYLITAKTPRAGTRCAAAEPTTAAARSAAPTVQLPSSVVRAGWGW